MKTVPTAVWCFLREVFAHSPPNHSQERPKAAIVKELFALSMYRLIIGHIFDSFHMEYSGGVHVIIPTIIIDHIVHVFFHLLYLTPSQSIVDYRFQVSTQDTNFPESACGFRRGGGDRGPPLDMRLYTYSRSYS